MNNLKKYLCVNIATFSIGPVSMINAINVKKNLRISWLNNKVICAILKKGRSWQCLVLEEEIWSLYIDRKQREKKIRTYMLYDELQRK